VKYVEYKGKIQATKIIIENHNKKLKEDIKDIFNTPWGTKIMNVQLGSKKIVRCRDLVTFFSIENLENPENENLENPENPETKIVRTRTLR